MIAGSHQGRELELMLSGLKPMALISVQDQAAAVLDENSPFSAFVDSGVISVFGFRHEELKFHVSCYCSPGEEWRGRFRIFAFAMSCKRPETRILSPADWTRMDSFLLGYPKDSTEELVQCDERHFGRSTIKLAHLDQGRVILRDGAVLAPRKPEVGGIWRVEAEAWLLAQMAQGDHAGRELELMLAGGKPMAMFMIADGCRPQTASDAGFLLHVQAGRLAQLRLRDDSSGSELRVYCAPTEEWRGLVAIWVRAMARAGFGIPDFTMQDRLRMDASLLGYDGAFVQRFAAQAPDAADGC